MKKSKSLYQWCVEKNRLGIIEEIDQSDQAYNSTKESISEQIEYNSSSLVLWKCSKGHSWKCEVVGRTLFGLDCPYCYPEKSILPVGAHYGCLTIIDNSSLNIKEAEEKYADAMQAAGYKLAGYKLYECQCKCGKKRQLKQHEFLSKKHRYCYKGFSWKDWRGLSESWQKQILESMCGLATQAEKKKTDSYDRVLSENYEVDYTGKTFESLEVLECIDENHEELSSYRDLRRKKGGTYKVYKLYRCRCYLCGKELRVKCSQFHIEPPTEYGPTATNGYWSGIQCDCHEISSFQWIVNKLLYENSISYKVEVSFPDLLGVSGIKPLRYDFGIYEKDGSLRCLIECNGEQHYKSVPEFGGERAFQIQEKNDDLKRLYAEEHGIPLIVIPYKTKKIEQIQSILVKHGILPSAEV